MTSADGLNNELVVLDCHDVTPGATFSVTIDSYAPGKAASLDAATGRADRKKMS